MTRKQCNYGKDNMKKDGNYKMISAKIKYTLLLTILLLIASSATASAQIEKRIAAFGSSVCNATGDETTEGGYIGRLTVLVKKYGFELINVSRGGDNTIKIQERWEKTDIAPKKKVEDNQYLLPVNPKFVIIGLSLANEGLAKKTGAGKDSIFEQFRTGIIGIIARLRQLGKIPVVANCYPNQAYSLEDYAYLRKINLIISSWDVPSIDLLDCIDDGSGRWLDGFYRDPSHPSSGGHREMFFTFPPTLFSALESGKQVPSFINNNQCASITYSNEPAFVYKPADTIHSFTNSFLLRNPDKLTLVKIDGMKGIVASSEYSSKNEKRISLNINASADTLITQLKYENGKIIYLSGKDNKTEAPFNFDKDKWYRVTLTHQSAKGETKVYIQDSLLLTVAERIIPGKFKIGLRGSGDYKDILLYRSALNLTEVQFNLTGNLFRSSLEIYSPLNDESFAENSEPKNFAQSLSKLYVKGKVVSITK